MAKFEVYTDKAEEYRWRLRADNGQIIASGEGYRKRNDCLHCIDLIKEQASGAEVVESD